jgi:hypothetical protein
MMGFDERVRGHRHVGPIARPLERERHVYIAIIGAAASLIAAGVGAYASHEATAQQEAAAKFNRQLALNEAEHAKNAAALEAQHQREASETFLARQRALIGASGVEFSGSPLAVLTETAQRAEREAQIIEYGGQVLSAGRLSQSDLYGFAARNARRAGPIGAGSTLLTGVSNAGSIYGGYASQAPSTTTGTGSPGTRARGAS